MKNFLKRYGNYILWVAGSFLFCLMPFKASSQIFISGQTTQGIEQPLGGIDTIAAENADQSVATEIGIKALFATTHYFETPDGKMHIIFMAALTDGNKNNGYAQVGYTFNFKITEDEKKVLLDSLPGTRYKIFDLSEYKSAEQYKDSIKNFWIENAYDITGITDNFIGKYKIVVFPNPTNGNLTVKSTKDLSHIVLYDIWGRIVYDQYVSKGMRMIQFNVPSLPAGMYILKAIGPKGKMISTEKIMKN